MSTDYMNDEPPIAEYGSWEQNEDGSATVTLIGNDEIEYDTPVVITFAQDGDTLTTAEWDTTSTAQRASA